MKMLNRAIEDAADYSAFLKELTKRQESLRDEVQRSGASEPQETERISGETRTERRARERYQAKLARKSGAKVMR